MEQSEMRKVGKVDIGFINDTDPRRLHARYFPSKVGGAPAWLVRRPPKPDHLLCSVCGDPLIFLAQIYAPKDDDDEAFHRTVFVFVCRRASCYRANEADNMKALRCQLRRDNEFYSSEPPNSDEEDDDPPFDDSKCPPLCKVCGGRGPSHCSKCKKVNYCGRTHQVYDWKNGHKEICSNDEVPGSSLPKNKLLFPEFELVIEEENEENTKEVSEEEELKLLEKLKKDKKAGSLIDESENELEAYTNKSVEDKIFSKFKKRTSRDPDQVLRYDRGGEPLWIASTSRVSPNGVPACQYCGGERQFEFQIMPQLLNFLDLDVSVNCIDWGILTIYTCVNSCGGTDEYKDECIFKQDIMNVPKSNEE